MEIQNDYTNLLLAIIFKHLKQFSRDKDPDVMDELIDFMKKLGISMDHFKEHLLTLSMDKKIVEQFENLDPPIKAAFTKAFNKEKEKLTGTVLKKGDAKAKPAANS